MTISGKSIYQKINGQVHAVEQQYESLNRSIYDNEAKITQLTQQREHDFAQLATFYLPSMDAESVTKTVHDLQARVESIFREKQERRQELDRNILQSREQKSEYEESLSQLDSQLEQKAAARDGINARISAELQETTGYTQLHKDASEA